jgi:hypothetical protein
MSIKVIWEGAEVRRRVLSCACPRCGAGQTERCITKTGQRHHHWHAARWYQSIRAGLVPVFCEDGEILP